MFYLTEKYLYFGSFDTVSKQFLNILPQFELYSI